MLLKAKDASYASIVGGRLRRSALAAYVAATSSSFPAGLVAAKKRRKANLLKGGFVRAAKRKFAKADGRRIQYLPMIHFYWL